VSIRLPALVALVAVAGIACRQDMHDQPKYEPFEGSEFFRDGKAMRSFVDGTVARETLREDTPYYTGKSGNDFVAEIPVTVTADLLERGRTEFEVFCSPCHGRTGMGDGMIVQRGFKRPSSYHVDRLRQMPIGYYFDVISRGYGAMSDYASQVPVEDRWAIAAYIRALQLSQYAPAMEVPAERRGELEESLRATKGADEQAAPGAGEHHP
jgi:mono/diheme cytochrome c family protein